MQDYVYAERQHVTNNMNTNMNNYKVVYHQLELSQWQMVEFYPIYYQYYY